MSSAKGRREKKKKKKKERQRENRLTHEYPVSAGF